MVQIWIEWAEQVPTQVKVVLLLLLGAASYLIARYLVYDTLLRNRWHPKPAAATMGAVFLFLLALTVAVLFIDALGGLTFTFWLFWVVWLVLVVVLWAANRTRYGRERA